MRLAIMETEGFAGMGSAAISAFEAVVAQLESAEVEIVRRSDDPVLKGFEQTLLGASKLSLDMLSWELQWTVSNVLV